MEIKLNLFERGLMKLGDLLFGASRKVRAGYGSTCR